jgi:hypothetical protein
MQVGRNLSKGVQIVVQARKIKIFRVMGEVRSYRGISEISNTIQQRLCLKFMSKNGLFHEIFSKNASFIRLDQYLPAT